MMNNHELHVELQGDYIIVTLPGTKFMGTYYKWADLPQLRAKSDWTDDADAPIALGAFRARAWMQRATRRVSSDGSSRCLR